MATIPDIQLSSTAYTDLYTVSGITVGTEILIQNKGPVVIVVQNSTLAPDNASWNGFLIPYMAVWVAPSGTTGVWAKGGSTVAVEVR